MHGQLGRRVAGNSRGRRKLRRPVPYRLAVQDGIDANDFGARIFFARRNLVADALRRDVSYVPIYVSGRRF